MRPSSVRTAMVGKSISDPHKNTATCKTVNDRLRRRVKRIERDDWKHQLEAGLLTASLTSRPGK
jgi:hypothetical protein